MTTLKTVIEAFKSGFNYLGADKKRQSRWYEFWYKSEFMRSISTDKTLTQAIEVTVKNFEEKLDELAEAGNIEFESSNQAFKEMIANLLHEVQVHRFQHGECTKEINYETSSCSTLDKVQTPKKPGLFEGSLIKGLQAVGEKHPELKNLMAEMISKINAAVLKPVKIYSERMTIKLGKPEYHEDHITFDEKKDIPTITF